MSILKGFLATVELRHPAIAKTIAKAKATVAARRRKDIIGAMISPKKNGIWQKTIKEA
jgi:hypothetical protein